MALVEHQALRVTRRLNLSASFYLTSPRMHDVRASLVPFCGKNFPSAEANANWLATNGLMSVRNEFGITIFWAAGREQTTHSVRNYPKG